MKKILSIILVLICIFSLFGCAGSSDEKQAEIPVPEINNNIEPEEYESLCDSRNTDYLHNDINTYDYEAIHPFSDGVALVELYYDKDLGRRYGYIDKEGNVVLELDDKYAFGFSFHDGLAVVAKKINGNSQRSVSDFDVIDKTGKLIIDGSNYKYISGANEGFIGAARVEYTYNETKTYTDIFDYEGNLLHTISGSNLGTYYTYDYNNLFDIGERSINEHQSEPHYAPFGCSAWYVDGYINIDGKTYDTNGKEVAYRKPKIIKSFSLRSLNVEDYGIAYVIESASPNRYIVELKNGFTAAVDKNGKYVFEPQHGTIRYLGENKYYNFDSGYVIDEKGNPLFSHPEEDFRKESNGWSSNYVYYYEGYIIAHDGKLVDDKGNKISIATVDTAPGKTTLRDKTVDSAFRKVIMEKYEEYGFVYYTFISFEGLDKPAMMLYTNGDSCLYIYKNGKAEIARTRTDDPYDEDGYTDLTFRDNNIYKYNGGILYKHAFGAPAEGGLDEIQYIDGEFVTKTRLYFSNPITDDSDGEYAVVDESNNSHPISISKYNEYMDGYMNSSKKYIFTVIEK